MININPSFKFPKTKSKSYDYKLQQNNDAEVLFPKNKNLRMVVKHEIQIIGNPRHTKKQRSVGWQFGFYTP